jgi:ligand-binding sensor domain-containing protein
MTHVLRFCLFLLTATCLHAQGFTIDVSPEVKTVAPKQNAVFTIDVRPTGGFSASIFLRGLAPTLNPAGVIIDPLTLNAPYTSPVTLTIVPAANEVGTHTIVVEARNGAVASYDTIVLTVQPEPGADHWTVHTTASSGLPSNSVTAVGFDRSGTSWIGTDIGLARALPGEGPRPVTGLEGGGAVGAIGLDSAGAVWVANSRGLWRYLDEVWTSYPLPPGILPPGWTVQSIAAAPDGTMWFGTTGGLLRLKESVWKLFTTEDWGRVIPSRIWNVVVTRKGDVWASVQSSDVVGRGVLKFDGNFWTTYSLIPSGLHDHSSASALTIDNADQIWILTYDGLATVSGTELVKHPTNFRSSSIATDRNGRLWVGSSWSGDPEALYSQQSGPWKAHLLSDAGLPVNTMMTRFAIHPDGSVWAGTYQNGLVILRPGNAATATGLSDRAISSDRLRISPNPLRSGGTIDFSTKGGTVRITLHDNVGREVTVLFNGIVAPGERSLPIDMSNIQAGAYLLSVAVDGQPASSRMVLVGR